MRKSLRSQFATLEKCKQLRLFWDSRVLGIFLIVEVKNYSGNINDVGVKTINKFAPIPIVP